jgi:AraC-like DNA-binding protein
MNLNAQLKALKALQARLMRLETQTLVSLPKEYGFQSTEAFARAIRHATRLPRQSSKRRRWVRPGGTLHLRRQIAELLMERMSAIEIALKLGLSLRVVDRAMARLESVESGSSRRRLRRGRVANKPARRRR